MEKNPPLDYEKTKPIKANFGANLRCGSGLEAGVEFLGMAGYNPPVAVRRGVLSLELDKIE